MCTWNLYDPIDQSHPNKFNKKNKVIATGEKGARKIDWVFNQLNNLKLNNISIKETNGKEKS